MVRFADRVSNVKPSAIREILHLTQQPDVISFAGGLPAPELFPVAKLREVANQVLGNRANLQYSITEGELTLRELLAVRTPGPHRADDLLVVSGSQQALDLVGKLLINARDRVIVEAPTYLGALRAFDVYEAEYCAVASDDEGIDPQGVERALKDGARFIYLNPNFSNPTGRTMSENRRHQIVDLARRYDSMIYEDDPYGELRFDGPPVPPMVSFGADCVLYVGSFSKVLVPGFRLGWIAGPADVIATLTMIKQAADLHTSTTTQAMAAVVIADGYLDEHIAAVRRHYLGQRDRMLVAIESNFPDGTTWTVPEGGMFIWLTLPEGIDATHLLAEAVELGVAYVPGAPFHSDGTGQNTLRLAYSVATAEEIESGICRLGAVLGRAIEAAAV